MVIPGLELLVYVFLITNHGREAIRFLNSCRVINEKYFRLAEANTPPLAYKLVRDTDVVSETDEGGVFL